MSVSSPRIATPNGVDLLLFDAWESDYSTVRYIDSNWSRTVGKHHKMAGFQAALKNFGVSDGEGTGPTPDEIRSWEGALGQGHPEAYGYVNGVFGDPDPGGSTPSSAYAISEDNPLNRDRYLMESGGTWLMNPRSEWWREDRLALCKSYLDAGGAWNGEKSGSGWNYIFIDNAGWTAIQSPPDEFDISNLGLETGSNVLPWNQLKGIPYTKADWMADCRDMIHWLRANLHADGYDTMIIVNGPSNGRERYFDATAPTSELVKAANGGVFETWLRASSDPVANFASVAEPASCENNWKLDLNAVLDMKNNGKTSHCMVKIWRGDNASPTPQADVDKWHRFAVASYLLVADGHHRLCFQSESSVAAERRRAAGIHNRGYKYSDSWDQDFGWPIDDPGLDVAALKISGVYRRRLDEGIVLVNPTAATVSDYALGGTYRAPVAPFHPTGDLSNITTITLGQNQAAVLVAV